MEKKQKTERNKLLDKGNFGTHHKPIAQIIGLNPAILLDFLIYKYDYFINVRKDYEMMGKHKAFYITYGNIEEGTGIKESNLGRKRKLNPIQVLVDAGLIMKKTIQRGYLKQTYFTVFFKNINVAYDKAVELQNFRRDEKKSLKEEKFKLMMASENNSLGSFLESNIEELKNTPKPNDNLILHNDSMDTVENSASKVQNIHITKNKITKNKKNKNQLTQEKESNEDDSPFTEEEINNMLNPNYSRRSILNFEDIEEDLFDPQLLYKAIIKTRTGAQKPLDFFNTIVNGILKDEFKGFKMSVEDELLIYDAIVNNPIFELENEDIEERDEEIEFLRIENENITQEEIDFDEELYEHLYNHLWEKILNNCYRIIDGKLNARFGNIFVGVKEMSENYALLIERY